VKPNIIPLSILCLLFFAGCAPAEERLSKQQWNERYKPETVRQGRAMAVLQAELEIAKGKVASLKTLDKIKIACGIGFFGSLIAFGVGFRKLGLIGAFACLALFCLAYAGSEHAKYLGYIGLAYGAGLGGYGLFVLITAFKEVVAGAQDVKNYAVSALNADRAGLNRILTDQQHKTTSELVEKIKVKEKIK